MNAPHGDFAISCVLTLSAVMHVAVIKDINWRIKLLANLLTVSDIYY